MCIAFLAVKAHPRYPLIVLANRDESFARPTRRVHIWPSKPGEPTIVAGQDEVSGGTWLGVNDRGQIALLTNYREPPESTGSRPSRGELITSFLRGQHADFAAHLQQSGPLYAGFNLIFGTPTQLSHYSNRSEGFTRLEPGLHGLSNALLDTPWPKVEKGKRLLQHALAKEEPALDTLFAILDDSEPATGMLPNTGLSPEIEHRLSSIRIPLGGAYGSRCATVVMVDSVGLTRLWERPYEGGPDLAFRVAGPGTASGPL